VRGGRFAQREALADVDAENPAPDGVEQPLGGSRQFMLDSDPLDRKYRGRQILSISSDLREGMMISWREYLTSDPKVCHGQLCAKGTRVMVTNILDSLAEGSNREDILRSYPSLKPVHIEAALAYAAELAREESLLPVSGL
jgi:uncharacterized protein (DUF433 family)